MSSILHHGRDFQSKERNLLFGVYHVDLCVLWLAFVKVCCLGCWFGYWLRIMDPATIGVNESDVKHTITRSSVAFEANCSFSRVVPCFTYYVQNRRTRGTREKNAKLRRGEAKRTTYRTTTNGQADRRREKSAVPIACSPAATMEKQCVTPFCFIRYCLPFSSSLLLRWRYYYFTLPISR